MSVADSARQEDRIARMFKETFAASPDFLARAPGRVDLIGAHTDYNDGWVLPAAITRTVWLAVRPIDDPLITVRATDLAEQVTFRLDALETRADIHGNDLPGWALYPAGVAWSMQQDGIALPGCQIVLSSDVPVGAGLSSSAAVEVAYASVWAHLSEYAGDRMALAQLCQRAENQYVGVNCGLMDQFACLFGKSGHALLFDCRTLDWEAVPLPSDLALVIADTGTRRTLANSHYNARRADCEEAVRILSQSLPDILALRDVTHEQFVEYRALLPERVRSRATHIIAENGRVRAAAEALQAGDGIALGHLMDESHISARDLYEASGPALNQMWKLSHGHPARLGGRFVGAGWAGCMIFLCRTDGCDDFVTYLSKHYTPEACDRPVMYIMQAAEGAQIVPAAGA